MNNLKTLFLVSFAILTFSASSCKAEEGENELQCSLKTCAIELFTFKDTSFGSLIKKAQTAIFCIRECSPPVVHEFFQSVSFAVTKRIPGRCSGDECIDVNRFVALGQCMKQRAWPLLQCVTGLVDLAELSLEPLKAVDRKNRTCSIVIQALSCFENNIEECGPKPYSLIQDNLQKPFQMGVNWLCMVEYQRKSGQIIPITTTTEDPSLTTPTRVPSMLPPVAKGLVSFKPNSSSILQVPTFLWIMIVFLLTWRFV